MRTFLFEQHNFVGSWVWEQFNQDWTINQGLAIGVYDNQLNTLVGGVTYHSFNKVEIWISMAGKEGTNWLSREFLYYIFHYPLVQLGVKNLRARITSDNLKSINLAERLGFTLEARCVDSDPKGDVLVYRINKQEAQRWLDGWNS